MSSKNKIVVTLMLLLLVLIIVTESSQKRINWFPTFSVKHKIPFGTYIAYEEAKKMWKNNLQDVNFTPYVYLEKNKNAKGTYVLYNSSINLGKTNLEKLLNWVEKGNNLFLSTNHFEQSLLDTLSIKQKSYFNKGLDAKLQFNLSNEQLKVSDSVLFDKSYNTPFFVVSDSVLQNNRIRELGRIIVKDRDTLYNFISYKYGDGTIYLHSFPKAFTNYFILKSKANQQYFEGMMSYINTQKPVLWDTHFQYGSGSNGVFEYILSNKAFLWAYRLTFIGLFLYVLFEGKRKQRPIPIVQPLKNETLQFTKTIADMYFENKENRQIALVHIRHFMDYVRTQLHIDTRKWDKNIMEKIAEKSKTDYKDVKQLFKSIDIINQAERVTLNDVLTLEKQINKIKE